MNNFLIVPDNKPSWEGFILMTHISHEDWKNFLNIAYIDKMISF